MARAAVLLMLSSSPGFARLLRTRSTHHYVFLPHLPLKIPMATGAVCTNGLCDGHWYWFGHPNPLPR